MRKQRRKVNVYELNTLKFMGIMAACAFTLVAFEWKSYDEVPTLDYYRTSDLPPEDAPRPVPKPKVKEVLAVTITKNRADPNNLIIVDNKDEILKTGPIVFVPDSMPYVPNIEPDFFEEEIVKPVEFPHVIAEFPGGDRALLKFLGNEINYPSPAFEVGLHGKVYLQFVVRKNGSIDQITVLQGIGGGCEEESVRALKESPKWKPGSVDGKAVDSYFKLPVKFTLSSGF
jgi:protein TonB